jgi:hypothetical protein
VDAAIVELNRAHFFGLIDGTEYARLDAELRALQPKARGSSPLRQLFGGPKSRLGLGWPRRRPRRSPDREKSRERARMLGGAAPMPPHVRGKYSECERAALHIVAAEVKRVGLCSLSIGEISARAGVCHRTTQNAIAEGVRQGHLTREERERKGQRNDTNVLRIVSEEWMSWITRGPLTGCKEWSAAENIDKHKRGNVRFPGSHVTSRDYGQRVARILRVSG